MGRANSKDVEEVKDSPAAAEVAAAVDDAGEHVDDDDDEDDEKEEEDAVDWGPVGGMEEGGNM